MPANSRSAATRLLVLAVALALVTASASAERTPASFRRLPKGVSASIKLYPGVAPLSIVSGYGSIWVASHRATDLYRIDPRTNRVIATIDVGQVSCGPIAAGLGQIWVTPCQDTWTLVRVNARTDRVVGRIPNTSLQVAFGDGSAWVGSTARGRGVVERIGAAGTIEARITVGSGPGAIVAGHGFIWVVNGNDGTLSQINPRSNRLIRTLPFVRPNSYGYLDWLDGRVWLSSGANGDPPGWLPWYDPRSGKRGTLRVRTRTLTQFGDDLAATGDDSFWIRTSDGVVSRVNPRTGAVVARYPADPDGGGGFLAVAQNALWIANFGSDTVWREDLKTP